MVFSEACHQGFSLGTPVSSPSSSFNGFSQKSKAEINAISTLSNIIAELSLDALHVIFTQLCHSYLSVRVGDSSWRSKEIVKNLKLRL